MTDPKLVYVGLSGVHCCYVGSSEDLGLYYMTGQLLTRPPGRRYEWTLICAEVGR